jgi:aminopeptidase N
LRAIRSSFTVFCMVLLGCTAAPALAQSPPREPFFPHAGSRGLDVGHYTVDLSYRPGLGQLQATASLDVLATQRLRRFSLDLFGLRVTSVLVDGQPARFDRGRNKLEIAPQQPLASGKRFSVLIRYQGRPQRHIDPDGSEEGWVRTDDGALAVGEPVGTAAWIPCNDVPADKATFSIVARVPERLRAISNGRLRKVTGSKGWRRFEWEEEKPMSPYLAVLDIGHGKLAKSTIAGLPSWTLVDPRMAPEARRPLPQLGRIIHFESKLFGPYPFESAGSIVDYAPDLGYALETQTRPIYAFVDQTTVVHETAHQWFGDSVGLERWPNIWLNEGFATWAEWYYAERHGGRSAQAIFERLHRVPASDEEFWDPPSGHPGTPAHLFGPSVYIRGAMALQVLRVKIGTEPMLYLLRTWASRHRYGSANIKQFIALAEQISGKNLQPLFQHWLYRRGKP